MGDHIIKLNDFLAKDPEMVGVVENYLKYSKQQPFLFKILSVAQPLSLQAHPDKKLATILHKQDPKNYSGSNHKPELASRIVEFVHSDAGEMDRWEPVPSDLPKQASKEQ